MLEVGGSAVVGVGTVSECGILWLLLGDSGDDGVGNALVEAGNEEAFCDMIDSLSADGSLCNLAIESGLTLSTMLNKSACLRSCGA